MKSFVIDTNILTHLLYGDPNISQRIRMFAPGEIGVTVITVEESLTGWHSQVRKSSVARNPERLASTYEKFCKAITLLKLFHVYSYTVSAMSRFKLLHHAKYNIGGNDLRIASIALEFDLVLVTRNVQHFDRIPGLHVEVW